jgi:hypothetical protein
VWHRERPPAVILKRCNPASTSSKTTGLVQLKEGCESSLQEKLRASPTDPNSTVTVLPSTVTPSLIKCELQKLRSLPISIFLVAVALSCLLFMASIRIVCLPGGTSLNTVPVKPGMRERERKTFNLQSVCITQF